MDCNYPNSTFISTKPALNLSARRLPPKLQVPRSKPSRLKKRLVVNKASGGANESDSGNGFVSNPSKIFMQEAIGAEYGEGFETFRMDGPLKVDVDYLNENLQGCFLQRIRHAMKPDEAFGLIFSWDNVVADTRTLKLDAWRQLALEMGKDFPNDAYALRTILRASPHYVLQKMDRKPSKCVVFEDDPRGVAAAHNCTMMAVALIGPHPAYELVQADLAVASFSELSIINIKRLFANKGTSFMDLQKQIIEKSPPKRKLMVDTIL